MLTIQLERIAGLDAQIERLDQEVARRLHPFADTVAALDITPGVGRRTAEVIAAEVGVAVAAFPTAGHLTPWAGVCPGNKQSAKSASAVWRANAIPG